MSAICPLLLKRRLYKQTLHTKDDVKQRRTSQNNWFPVYRQTVKHTFLKIFTLSPKSSGFSDLEICFCVYEKAKLQRMSCVCKKEKKNTHVCVDKA